MKYRTSNSPFYSNPDKDETLKAGVGCGCWFIFWLISLVISFILGDYIISSFGGADALANWLEVPWYIKVIVYSVGANFVIPAAIIALLLSVFGLAPLF